MKILKSKWTWIIAAAVVVLAGLAMKETGKGTPVRTAKAVDREIRSYVEDRAETSLPVVHTLCAPVSGRVEAVPFRAGDAVRAGQVVARMAPFELENAAEQARARVRALEAELAVGRDTAIESTMMMEMVKWISAMDEFAQAANATVTAARAESKFSAWWLDAVKRLQQEGAMAEVRKRRAEMEDAQAKVSVAVSDTVSKGVYVIKLISDLGPRYVSEYLKLKHLKGQVIQARLEGARAAQAKAEHDLALGNMTSPVDGVVLKRFVDSERFLNAGEPVASVGDLSKLEVTADILSQQAGLVRAGDKAEITGEVLGDLVLPGTVKRVKPLAYTKVSSLGVDQQRVHVVISLDPGDLDSLAKAGRGLGLGYRVQARIYTAERKGALVIPRSALFRDEQGGWRVFTVEKGKAKSVAVQLGLGNEDMAQVTGGLSSGDEVVLTPPKALKDGDKVAAEAAK